MATILANIATTTLKNAAINLGTNELTDLGTQIFGISPPGQNTTSADQAQILQSLQALKTQLDGITASVSQLSQQIQTLGIDIKTDELSTYVQDINALYTQYMAALCPDVPSTATADVATVFQDRQASLVRLGTQVANDLYRWLQQIHTLLAGQGATSLLGTTYSDFITPAVSSTTGDVVVFYWQLKSLLLNYLVVQVQGLQLLTLVSNPGSGVPFAEGAQLISDINGNLDAQETYFESLVGPNQRAIAESLLFHPMKFINVNMSPIADAGTPVGVAGITNLPSSLWGGSTQVTPFAMQVYSYEPGKFMTPSAMTPTTVRRMNIQALYQMGCFVGIARAGGSEASMDGTPEAADCGPGDVVVYATGGDGSSWELIPLPGDMFALRWQHTICSSFPKLDGTFLTYTTISGAETDQACVVVAASWEDTNAYKWYLKYQSRSSNADYTSPPPSP